MSSTASAAVTGACNPRLLFAGVSGCLGVVLGALGSHAFLNLMDVEEHKAYQVANQYHLVHSFAMMAVAAVLGTSSAASAASSACPPAARAWLEAAWALFAAGTVAQAAAVYVRCTLKQPECVLRAAAAAGLALLAGGWLAIGGAALHY